MRIIRNFTIAVLTVVLTASMYSYVIHVLMKTRWPAEEFDLRLALFPVALYVVLSGLVILGSYCVVLVRARPVRDKSISQPKMATAFILLVLFPCFLFSASIFRALQLFGVFLTGSSVEPVSILMSSLGGYHVVVWSGSCIAISVILWRHVEKVGYKLLYAVVGITSAIAIFGETSELLEAIEHFGKLSGS